MYSVKIKRRKNRFDSVSSVRLPSCTRSRHACSHFFPSTACFHYAGKFEHVVSELRWWQNTYPFQTEPVRLLLSLLSQGHDAAVAFNEHRLQKFLIRQMKEIGRHSGGKTRKEDGIGSTPGPSGTQSRSSPEVSRKGRKSSLAGEDDDEEEEGNDGEGEEEEGDAATESTRASSWKPSVLSPVFFSAYGFMLMNSQSFQTAISALVSLPLTLNPSLLLY